MSHSFGQNLIIFDDSGFLRLIQVDPHKILAKFTEVEWITRKRESSFGDRGKKVTFLNDLVELEIAAQTSSPLMKGFFGYSKLKRAGDEILLEGESHSKAVVFETGHGSEEENEAVLVGSGIVSGVKFELSSEYTDRTLTKYGSFELEAITRAKVDEMGHCLNFGPIGGFVCVRALGSYTVPPVVEANRTKSLPDQLARIMMK